MPSAFRLRIALSALACALAAAPVSAAQTFINVLTGSSTGVYHALGVALGEVLDAAMPETKSAVQATRTSAENLNLLQAGRGDVAFAAGDVLSDAWKGNEVAGFKAPLRKLRGIAAIYPNYIQFIARADSGIRKLADLRGKKISVGVPKSATDVSARAILHAAGIDYKDFAKIEYAPFGESIELMKERQIDVTLQSAGVGASALRDLANAIDIVVVPIPADVIRNIDDPAYIPVLIPAYTYRGQTRDVPATAVLNYLVTRDDEPVDTVYGVTKAMWTGVDQLAAANAAARAMDVRKALEGMPVPLHPGAERYYREIGLIR
jgi:TRAP transporter TAXI family solute receptor